MEQLQVEKGFVDKKTQKTVIDSFVNREDEYRQFLETIEEDKEVRFIKGMLYVFLSNESKEIVEEGMSLYNKLSEITRKKEDIDLKLKKYASKLIHYWNKKNKTDVSSVRFCPNSAPTLSSNEKINQSILVSTKKSYTVNVDDLLLLKDEIGNKFNDIFKIEETLVLKKEELCRKILFELIFKTFGELGLKYFFDIKQSIIVKDAKKFDELLESDHYSNDLKRRLNKACVKSNPSITYPR